jgi:hypothetical protein
MRLVQAAVSVLNTTACAAFTSRQLATLRIKASSARAQSVPTLRILSWAAVRILVYVGFSINSIMSDCGSCRMAAHFAVQAYIGGCLDLEQSDIIHRLLSTSPVGDVIGSHSSRSACVTVACTHITLPVASRRHICCHAVLRAPFPQRCFLHFSRRPNDGSNWSRP